MAEFWEKVKQWFLMFIEFFKANPPPLPPGENTNEPVIIDPVPEPKEPVAIEIAQGFWIWVVDELHPSWFEKAVAAKVGRIYLKIMDDLGGGKLWAQADEIKKYVAQNIECYGWGYHFTTNPNTGVVSTPNISNIVASIRTAVSYGMKGYIFDLESELENSATRTEQAIGLIKAVRAVAPKIELGFSTFDLPNYHPGFPYKKLADLPEIDSLFPQNYENLRGVKDGADYIERLKDSETQHRKLGITKPIRFVIGVEPGAKNNLPASEIQKVMNYFKDGGVSLYRMHASNEEVTPCLQVKYNGNPKPIVTTSAPVTTFQAKLHAYYSDRANYNAVGANVKSWRTDVSKENYTSNGCVAFMSTACRLSKVVDIPNKSDSKGERYWLVTRPFRNYLESLGWVRIKDANSLIPGDMLFSQDEPGWDDYPAHVYMLDAWVQKPYTATVIDNQGFKYVRNIASTGNKTPFAYALRPKA